MRRGLHRGGLAAAAAIALALLGGVPAQSAPLVPVQITGVSATVTVELGGSLIGQTAAPIAVTGTSLVFDAGAPAVSSFSIALAGAPSSQIDLNAPVDIGFGPFDRILVDSALLTSIVSATYPAIDFGGGFYQFAGVPNLPGDPVASVTSSVTLWNSGGGSPLMASVPFPVSSLTGTLLFTGFNPGDFLDFGLTFPLATFTTTTGEILQIKGDLLLTGTVVPEPDAALLMGLALLCVGMRVRSGRAKVGIAA
jgi:hypothetical protein